MFIYLYSSKNDSNVLVAKTRMAVLSEGEKMSYILYEHDGQTDRETDTALWHMPRYRFRDKTRCRDVGRKSRFFSCPPPLRGTPSELRHNVLFAKTRMAGLSEGEKMSHMFICFDIIHYTNIRT